MLVHGGFVDGWYWGATAALLEKEGHPALVADLPSTGTDPAALGDLFADAATVRDLLGSAEGPVGAGRALLRRPVITEVADHPAIARTVYLSAFWPGRGQSLMDLLPAPLDWIVPTDDGAAVRVTDDVDRAAEALCADLDPSRRAEWHGHLMYSGAAGLGTPAVAPDRDHHVTFVVLEKDAAVLPEWQEAMAARADRVERMSTSHTAQLVDPAGLAAILSRVPL